MNPFAQYRFEKSLPLGRDELTRLIKRRLLQSNLNLVGPRKCGKSSLVRQVAEDPEIILTFRDMAIIDFAGFDTQLGDDGFFQHCLAAIEQQVDGAKEWKDYFTRGTGETLVGYVEELARDGRRLLIILDNVDNILVQISGTAWGQLRSLDAFKTRFLLTGRASIKDLESRAEHAGSRLSDRFTNRLPVTPFSLGDIRECCHLVERTGYHFDDGATKSILRWTGGYAPLTVALLWYLCEAFDTPQRIGVDSVDTAAVQLLADLPPELEEHWEHLGADHSIIADSWEAQRFVGSPQEEQRLLSAGLLSNTGGRVELGCDLIKRYAATLQANSSTLKRWFGKKESFHRSMKVALQERLRSLDLPDGPILNGLKRAVESMLLEPNETLNQMRPITHEMLSAVLNVECSNGIPDFWDKEMRLKWDRVPSELWDKLSLLEHLVRSDKWKSPPKVATRTMYAAAASVLREAGNFVNHPGEGSVSPSFAATSVHTAIELAAEIKAVGII